MSNAQEVEIKVQIADLKSLASKLRKLGFRLVTKRTHEMNILYDLHGSPLQRRGAILRVRQYGAKWTVTYKDKKKISSRPRDARHKSRREIETQIQDGQTLSEILAAVGFKPSFAYEKFRSEWSDRTGHVVIDETPIGNFAEIEGPPQWIDRIAKKLAISGGEYITKSYGELFLHWKKKTRSKAVHMLFSS